VAVTNEQKIDFLLKKIGFTKTKTGSVVGTGAISGTGKQPFAEAIPSPLVVPNSSLWNEAGSIPATAPGSDTPQVKVYLAGTSGLRMTADATSSGQRAYIAYTTYNDTSSARLTNWIDTQFGASYLIKVYKGDPNSGGVALSAAGSGANDGWFFDYSAGVLNFNDTFVPSGVTDTNIYIVGYRYIGQTGAPTSGISTFSHLDLTVERNLDVGKQGGISTFRNNIDLNADLDVDGHTNLDNVSVAGVITATTFVGNGDFVELDVDGHTNLDNLSVAGVSTFTGDATFSGNVSIGGTLTYEDVVNVDSVGIITAQAGIRVTGGVIEALAGENKIPSLYAAMGNLPSAGSYHGMFAHVHATGRGYFAHAGNWYELVNKEVNGVVGTGTETYNIGNLVSVSSTATSFNVTGVTTVVTLDVNGDIDVDGHTNLDNLSIAGVSTHSEGIFLPDDKKLELGNASGSGDIQIRHVSSSNLNVIESTTGSLRINQIGNGSNISILATNVYLKNHNNNETYLHAVNNGAVSLYYDNSIKFATSAKGIKVGTGVTIETNGQATFTGIVTASTYYGIGANLTGDIDVDGHANLDNVSIAGFTTITQDLDVDGHTNLDNLSVAGVSTFAGTVNTASIVATGIDLNGDLDVDGHTNLDNISIAGVTTFASGVRFNGSFGVHDGTTGSSGQYLRATGTGVTWSNFPTMRTSQTFTASSGQTTFSFTYNVGFLDVFVNGVKLTSSEFTATNGTSVVLSVGSFVGDIVELVSYFTTSYAAGASGLGNIVEDTTPQLGGNLDLFNKSITGTGNVNITGIITATNFVGDGSGLTGITASGSGVVVKDSGSTVGTAGTINFGDNLSVSPASAGIVTVTASAGASSTAEVRANTLVVTGVSTLTNIDVDDFIDVGSNIQLGSVGVITALTFKGNGDFVELDVDGHTNLDNVNVAGVSTFAGTVNTDAISASGALSVSDIRSNALTLKNAAGSASYAVFSNGGSALLKHNNTDRLETSASGVTVTGTVAATSYTGDGSNLTGVGIDTSQLNVNKLDVSGISTFKGNIDVNADLDVDGHTNLDNVSVAGVVTATTFVGALTGNASGNAATATALQNARTIGGVSFDGTANINLPGVNASGNQDTSGTAAVATNVTVSANNSTNETVYPVFVDGATGSQGAETDTGLNYNPSTGALSSLKFIGDGSGLTGVSGSGSGIAIKNSGSIVGTAGTINFGDNLSVSAISGGSVTVTATAGVSTSQFDVNKLDVSGISTFSGNIDVNADLDVDGHTNLDNVSIAGVVTATSFSGPATQVTVNDESSDTTCFPTFVTAATGNLSPKTGSNLSFNSSTGVLSATSFSGDGSNLTGVTPAIGITTNLSGSFTASAGTAATINTLTGYSANDLVVEYTIYIKNGSDFQTQKLLAMRDGTTIHSTQFAVMFSSSLLVQCDATISSGNILLRATPETGVSGSTTYKIKREVM